MRRITTIFLTLFQALWFNVIVPGHQRGIVQLPGASQCPSCCCASNSSARSPHDKPETPEQRAKNCAVCYFSAHLSLPPTFAFDHAMLAMLGKHRPDGHDDLFARIVLVPFDSCGPPSLS